jgi:hypothetical protein
MHVLKIIALKQTVLHSQQYTRCQYAMNVDVKCLQLSIHCIMI